VPRGSVGKRTILTALRELLTVTVANLGRTPISYGFAGRISPLMVFFKGATSITGGTPLGSYEKAGAKQFSPRDEDAAHFHAVGAGGAIGDARLKSRRSGLPRTTHAVDTTLRLARPAGDHIDSEVIIGPVAKQGRGDDPHADHRARARLERTSG
jgi:hypothetical protein